MKFTTKQLRQMIKEALDEIRGGTQFYGDLEVMSKPDGGWVIRGTFNDHRVNIDSSYKAHKSDMSHWVNSPRYTMAQELLGHFGKDNEHFVVRKQDLDGVRITVDGREV